MINGPPCSGTHESVRSSTRLNKAGKIINIYRCRLNWDDTITLCRIEGTGKCFSTRGVMRRAGAPVWVSGMSCHFVDGGKRWPAQLYTCYIYDFSLFTSP